MLNEIHSNLLISQSVDKEPYIKNLTNDKIINITGESGSGKSFYTNKYKNNNDYIIIDTDILFSNKDSNKEILALREILKKNFKDNFKEALIYNFDECYKIILNYFKDSDKTIIIDSAQYRNIKDISILKGQIIVMRTSIDKCYERCINRYINNNPNYTKEELDQYKQRKINMYQWYKSINEFIIRVEYKKLEYNLNKKSKEILNKLKEIYGIKIEKYKDKDFIKVDKPDEEDLKFFSSYDNIPSGHGGRTKNDDCIHFYPYSKTFKDCKKIEDIEKIITEDLLVHEILHFFIKIDIEINDKIENEFQHFLNEGIVQFFTEKYHRINNLNIPKSNYNKNVKYAKILYWSLLNAKNSEEETIKMFFYKKYDEILNEVPIGKYLLKFFKEDKKMHEKFNQVLIEICNTITNEINFKNTIKHFEKQEKLEDMICELEEIITIIDNPSLIEECLNVLKNNYPEYYLNKKLK